MVLLPEKRNELFRCLQALASPEYQQRVWINGDYPPEIGHDSFGYVITFFFEDTMLAEAPENNLESILEYDEEVPLIAKVGEALMRLLNAMGDDRSDAEYVNSPHWRMVVSSASQAIEFYSQQAGR